MEHKPTVEPEEQSEIAVMAEEIRQLREEVASAKRPRGIIGRLKARVRRTRKWLVDGMAPVGEADKVENQNAVVQFLERRMRTKSGKFLILLVSAVVFIFWGIVVLQMMR